MFCTDINVTEASKAKAWDDSAAKVSNETEADVASPTGGVDKEDDLLDAFNNLSLKTSK